MDADFLLIRQMKQGDEASFDVFVRKYYKDILNYCTYHYPDREYARDITQEVFLIAYRKGDDFLSHENPMAFLYVSAKNLLFEHFREKAKLAPLEEWEIEDSRGDIFEQLRINHVRSIDEDIYFNRVLSSLSKRERKLYELYYVLKKPMKAIAKELHLSEPALRMKYVRLRKKVRRIVADLDLDAF